MCFELVKSGNFKAGDCVNITFPGICMNVGIVIRKFFSYDEELLVVVLEASGKISTYHYRWLEKI